MGQTQEPLHLTALAFDFGLKKIGVAVGQTITKTARPLCILPATNGLTDQHKLEELIKNWRPNVIVIGMPKQDNLTNYQASNNSNHNPNKQITEQIEKFIKQLKTNFTDKYKFEIIIVDESFSSIEAKKIFIELRQQKLIKQGEKLDHIAACVILQRWLDNI